MLRHVESKQGCEPQDGDDCYWDQEKFGVVEERKGVVAEESGDEVVCEGEEIERVGEEDGEPGM